MKPCILVTGGAGFIGSNFILHWIGSQKGKVVNLDKLTYAGNLDHLSSLIGNNDHVFIHGDICDRALIDNLLTMHRPQVIVHLAAETHVDRSILAPADFIKTNIDGTFSLLSAVLKHYESLGGEERDGFRFLHVSTDEVYGSLAPNEPPFQENTPFAPNSPYAASKAASDHLVRAWVRTYGLPAIVTHCSNNFGPRQVAEKLIPLTISRALAGQSIPIYGDGLQVRDWIYVLDHCKAMETVLEQGNIGAIYNIGGGNQQTNLNVVHHVCHLLDELSPNSPFRPHKQLIRFVEDRPGHDRRYAVDSHKIRSQLEWQPAEDFGVRLRQTVEWYVSKLAK